MIKEVLDFSFFPEVRWLGARRRWPEKWGWGSWLFWVWWKGN